MFITWGVLSADRNRNQHLATTPPPQPQPLPLTITGHSPSPRSSQTSPQVGRRDGATLRQISISYLHTSTSRYSLAARAHAQCQVIAARRLLNCLGYRTINRSSLAQFSPRELCGGVKDRSQRHRLAMSACLRIYSSDHCSR